jgi:histidyl-tRNA synthetase
MSDVSVFQEILQVSFSVLSWEINYKKDFGLEYYKLCIFESVLSLRVL